MRRGLGLSEKSVRKRLAPIVEPVIVEKPIMEKSSHSEKILQHIEKNTEGQYVQGQDTCPICQGVINYTWSKFHGFLVYECSKNDCLPWPVGGAKRRRENGEPKLERRRK